MHGSIFKTTWGWFGVLASEAGLRRTCLPMAGRQDVEAFFSADSTETPRPDRVVDPGVELIRAYFQGIRVDFLEVPVDLNGFSPFERRVLDVLRSVGYGQTVSYTDLAALAGRPKAVRAVANAVAKNPLPLIIPCHRVLRKDGSLGGFSAPGGVMIKKRLLALECE